jgi:diguanylate cyclase (GGDEF)-like protein
LAAADRSGHSISCFVVDVDYFKRLNDEFGHESGDAVCVSWIAFLIVRRAKST